MSRRLSTTGGLILLSSRRRTRLSLPALQSSVPPRAFRLPLWQLLALRRLLILRRVVARRRLLAPWRLLATSRQVPPILLPAEP